MRNNKPPYSCKHSGFTLIEVLIALAILAIALTALVKATSNDIEDSIRIKDKNIALWVAATNINRIKLGLTQENQGETKMFGQTWYWQANQTNTPAKNIQRLILSVTKTASGQQIVNLSTFNEGKS